jgi:hypothetical protein
MLLPSFSASALKCNVCQNSQDKLEKCTSDYDNVEEVECAVATDMGCFIAANGADGKHYGRRRGEKERERERMRESEGEKEKEIERKREKERYKEREKERERDRSKQNKRETNGKER